MVSSPVGCYARGSVMPQRSDQEDDEVRSAMAGLRRGDFSRLEPLFSSGDQPAQIIEWHRRGLFAGEPRALAEALTCACFLGCLHVAEYLLAHGVDPAAGNGTGLDALHWAANRGQLEAVRLLIRHGAPLEARSMYGGTVLGTATWSAVNEPRAAHVQIVEELLSAGANVDQAEYPTGHADIDAVLRRHGSNRGE